MDPSAELQARQALGRALADLRATAGYRQETFAPLTGYSRSTLANVETGRQRVPRRFWVSCDDILHASGRLTAEYDRIDAARRDHQRQGAHTALDHDGSGGAGAPPAAPLSAALPVGDRAAVGRTHQMVGADPVGLVVDQAADDGVAQAALAAAGLDATSMADLYEQISDLARGYAARHRGVTFVRARRCRDFALELTARTRRPSDLVDAYLLASLTNALMASAAFDLARGSAATSLARASRTFAELSGHPSALGWAYGLVATLLNWQNRPAAALQEIERGLATVSSRAAKYRLYCIAARAYALRRDHGSARDALEQAARHRPDDRHGRDLLQDEIGGELQFDAARASACAGAVWLHLADAPTAERALHGALAAYAQMPSLERPTAPVNGARADLAAACLLRNDLEAAEQALVPVFGLHADQRISVLAGRMTGVATLLRTSRWDGVAQARALGARIDDWMVSAQALPGGGVS